MGEPALRYDDEIDVIAKIDGSFTVLAARAFPDGSIVTGCASSEDAAVATDHALRQVEEKHARRLREASDS